MTIDCKFIPNGSGGHYVSIMHPLPGYDYWEVHLNNDDGSFVDLWAFNGVGEAFRKYYDTLALVA